MEVLCVAASIVGSNMNWEGAGNGSMVLQMFCIVETNHELVFVWDERY